MAALSANQAAFLRDNAFVGVATTLRGDGSPHNTPVWVDADGAGNPQFNTAHGRAKPRHIAHDGRIALTVVDPQNAFRWLSVSGSATLVDEGADEQIDRLALKYLGQSPYPFRTPDEVRTIVHIDVDKIDEMGIDQPAPG
jgi:PPOX class probable F420-dependent enzyme